MPGGEKASVETEKVSYNETRETVCAKLGPFLHHSNLMKRRKELEMEEGDKDTFSF